jgi:hypothetical protein
VEKKTGPAARTVSEAEELKKFIGDGEVAVVGFFEVILLLL